MSQFHVLKHNGKPVDERLGKKALIHYYMGTKADLARKMNIHHKSVCRILNPSHNSKSETLNKALHALGIEITVAFDGLQLFVAWRPEPRLGEPLD